MPEIVESEENNGGAIYSEAKSRATPSPSLTAYRGRGA